MEIIETNIIVNRCTLRSHIKKTLLEKVQSGVF